MSPSTMKYQYSTRNFHRYQATNNGTLSEVYIPRADMPQPVAEISVTPTITNPAVVAEAAKPEKPRR